MTAYAGTKAQPGKGTLLTIGAAPGTVVGEVRTIKLSGRQMGTDDATNMQSTAEEFITTLMNPGEWDVEMSRVSGDAGQVAIETAFEAGTLSAFTVTLPKTGAQVNSGDSFSFNALVISIDPSFEPKKAIISSVKLKVSGAITFTPGT